jgi:hypothetical protein
MENKDKFGRPIYGEPYQKMLENGRVLTQKGYQESKNKPNLFFKKTPEAIFFADMRGTDVVPIWEDPSPLLYASFNEDLPLWKRKRLLKQEGSSLQIARFSFYEECEPDGLLFSDGGDGYCLNCGKDFEDDGEFCSSTCEEEYKSKRYL